jgi:hypothetical protein
MDMRDYSTLHSDIESSKGKNAFVVLYFTVTVGMLM